MKQQKILNLISSAVDKKAPDCWDNIKLASENSGRGVKNMSEIITESKNTKKGLFMGLSMAAAVAVVVGATSVFASAMTRSYVAIDINPSIELEANGFGTVTDVYGVNDDAKALMEDMDIKGEKLEEAVGTIIEGAIDEGYVSDAKENAILVSVDGKKEAVAEELKEKVTSTIDDVLAENVIDATVKTQNLEINDDIIEDAHTKGISAGRLKVIERIMDEDDTVNLKDISKISVSDLFEYANDKDISLNDLLDNVEDAYNNANGEEKDNNNNKYKDKVKENNKYKTKNVDDDDLDDDTEVDEDDAEKENNSNKYKDKVKENNKYKTKEVGNFDADDLDDDEDEADDIEDADEVDDADDDKDKGNKGEDNRGVPNHNAIENSNKHSDDDDDDDDKEIEDSDDIEDDDKDDDKDDIEADTDQSDEDKDGDDDDSEEDDSDDYSDDVYTNSSKKDEKSSKSNGNKSGKN